MKKLLFLTFMVTIVAFLFTSCCGCRGAKSKNPHTLERDGWHLVEINGKENQHVQDRAFTLNFDTQQKRIYGKGDCNRYFASYQESNVRKLKISEAGSTRMMCPNQQEESDFLKMLNSTESYTIDGDMLMLLNKGEVIAVFKAVVKETAVKGEF